jgi:TRAP transporter TAXI family solute receptor
MIRDGKAELALVQADTSFDASKGQDKFAGKPVDHRTLAVVYPNLLHIVTMEGAGIEKLGDIKGKRISTGAPVSASEVMAARVMEAIGLTNNDIKRERLAPAESTAAMKDGKLDGYFFNGGPPVAAITDLGATQGITLKLIPTADLVEKINAKYGPLYSRTVIKANAYPGQDKEVPVVGVWNLLVAPASMSEQDAYTIVKTLWESREELVATHKAALDMLPDNQKKANTPVAFHPGALKYFAEKGIKVE